MLDFLSILHPGLGFYIVFNKCLTGAYTTFSNLSPSSFELSLYLGNFSSYYLAAELGVSLARVISNIWGY